MSVESTLHLLVIGPDSSLAEELEAALASLRDARIVVTSEREPRRAVEVVRAKQPELVCIAMESDVEPVRLLGAELSAVAPRSAIFAAYRPEGFGEEEAAARLISVMRSDVRDFLRRPVSTAELEQVLRRHLGLEARQPATDGRTVSFVSNKGGVGKSTLAVNTACRLARRGTGSVLLIDASLQLGVCAPLLGLTPETTLTDAVRSGSRLDETLLRSVATRHASGVDCLAAPRDALEASNIDDVQMAGLLRVARRAYDTVVVDTFPIVDSVLVAILDVSDLVFLVINGMIPTLRGVEGMTSVLERIGVAKDRERLVLNQNHGRFSGALRPREIAAELRRDVDFVVPYSRKLLTSTNVGEPLALRTSRRFGFGRSVHELAREIDGLRGTTPERSSDGDRPPVVGSVTPQGAGEA